jgi:hypothetical protein
MPSLPAATTRFSPISCSLADTLNPDCQLLQLINITRCGSGKVGCKPITSMSLWFPSRPFRRSSFGSRNLMLWREIALRLKKIVHQLLQDVLFHKDNFSRKRRTLRPRRITVDRDTPVLSPFRIFAIKGEIDADVRNLGRGTTGIIQCELFADALMGRFGTETIRHRCTHADLIVGICLFR